MHMQHHDTTDGMSTRQTPRTLAWKGAAIMVAVIVVFYVLREHWGHVLGFLPYLLLLACPLMHLFMHHGHGHGQHEGEDRQHKN